MIEPEGDASTKPPIQLLLNIEAGRFSLTRCDGLVPDFTISIEQQVMNPKLGLVCAGSSYGNLERAIKEAIAEAQRKNHESA